MRHGDGPARRQARHHDPDRRPHHRCPDPPHGRPRRSPSSPRPTTRSATCSSTSRGCPRRASSTTSRSRSGAGEIVGMAGLVGAGRTEVARVLFGIDQRDAGEVTVAGRPVRFASPSDAMDAGHRLPPREPPRGGPRPRLLDRPERHPADPSAAVPAVARQALDGGAASPASTPSSSGSGRPAWTSSSGRCRAATSRRSSWPSGWPRSRRVLILDEPTRGIDIGAKVEVHRIISDLAASGLAIVLISSDLPEVLAMSDRILVLHEGRITRRDRPGRGQRGAGDVRGDRPGRAEPRRRRIGTADG